MLNYQKRTDEKIKSFNLALNDFEFFTLKKHSYKNRHNDVEGAMNIILSYYKINAVSIPFDIDEDSEKFEYVKNVTGLTSREIVLENNWWKQFSVPLVVSTKDSGYTVLEKSAFGGYKYFDFGCGKMVRVTKSNAEFFDTAYCFYKPFPQKKLKVFDLLRFVISALTIFDVSAAIFSVIASILTGLAMPLVNKYIFDIIIPSGDYNDLLPIVILLSGIVVSASLLSIVKKLSLERIINKVKLYFESATFHRLLILPLSFFKDYSSGELSSYIGNIEMLCETFCNVVLTTLFTTLFFFAYLIQINNFASFLTVPTVFIITVMLIFIIISAVFEYKKQKDNIKLSAELFGLVNQMFRGIEKLKIFGMEMFAFARWAKLYNEKIKRLYNKNFIVSIDESVLITIVSFGVLIIYYNAGKSDIKPSDFIAFNVAYTAIITTFMKLMGVAKKTAFLIPMISSVMPVYTAEPEADASKKQLKELKGNILVSNVSFSYEGSDKLILNNVSMEAKSGEYIGIVGTTGCGKSTLLKLLLGFEKAKSGAIYYDEQDIEDIDLRTLRQKIGTVMQNGRLVNDSIFENITAGNSKLTTDDVWEAASIAGIAKDTKAMPMGLFTIIPESGGGISGGQRQRIMIARAVANKPKILYFDEATSALDNSMQAEVIENIDKMDCTKIVIAHRLSTVKNCDKIIVLDGGEVVQQGTYNELISVDGVFKTLAMHQTI